MKVLVISSAFPPITNAGEADHAYHLCKKLAEAGVEIYVLTRKGNGLEPTNGVRCYSVMERWSWAEVPRFARVMKQTSPDAVILLYSGGHLYNNHPMITFTPTLTKIILPGTRVVTQFENTFPPGTNSIIVRGFRKMLMPLIPWIDAFGTLLRGSDRVIVLSERQQKTLAKYCPRVEKRSIVNPPPPIIKMTPDNGEASIKLGREKLGVSTNDLLIAYFGYIYPGKGVEKLLKAFQIVTRSRKNVRLVLIGGKVETPKHSRFIREIERLPGELGISEKVIWTGSYAWNSDEPSLYLHSADICVLPFDKGVSLNNSSFAVAAAHGLPIVTTKGEEVEQPFVHQENVLLCPPENPSLLASMIEMLIDNPILRQHLSGGALELAREWFSWDKAIERTVSACAM